jgi:hypothetical protein
MIEPDSHKEQSQIKEKLGQYCKELEVIVKHVL